jgi:hypothetical protein
MSAENSRTLVGGLTGYERDLNWHKVMYNFASVTSSIELERDDDSQLKMETEPPAPAWRLALTLADANDRAALWAAWPFHRGSAAKETRTFLVTAEPAALIVLAGAVVSDVGRSLRRASDRAPDKALVDWATRQVERPQRYRAPEVPVNRWLGRRGHDRRCLRRAFDDIDAAYQVGAPEKALSSVSELINFADPRGAPPVARAVYNLACFDTRVARALPGDPTEPIVRQWLDKALDRLMESLRVADGFDRPGLVAWAPSDPALSYLRTGLDNVFQRRLRPFTAPATDPNSEQF